MRLKVELRGGILFLLLVAAALRVAAVLLYADPHTVLYEYMLIARNLVGGLGYSYDDCAQMPMQPTSLFPPLYVYWCALFLRLFPANFLPLYITQAVVSASGVIPAFRLGTKLVSRNAGLFFAVLYSIYPELIFLPVRPVPEALFVVLVLWHLDVYSRLRDAASGTRRALVMSLGLGGLAGVGLLMKESMALVFGAALLALALNGRFSWRVVRGRVLPALLVVAVVLLPWVVRNWQVQERLIVLRTGFGMNLWMGNHAGATGTARTWEGECVRYQVPPEAAAATLSVLPSDEQDRDDYYLAQAMRFIREQPLEYLRLCGKRLFYFLWFDPTHPLTGHVAYWLAYVLLLPLALFGAILLWRWKRMDPVLPLIFAGGIVLYVPVMMLPRYRILPLIVYLLCAAVALEAFLFWLGRRRSELSLRV